MDDINRRDAMLAVLAARLTPILGAEAATYSAEAPIDHVETTDIGEGQNGEKVNYIVIIN